MSLSKEANERLWDAVIKEALIEAMKNELKESEQDVKLHNFSPQFEKKMKKLIKSIGIKERIHTAGKFFFKFTVAAAAVMGIMFGGFLTRQEVYAAVGNVIKSVFSSHDSYTYTENNEDIVFDDTKRFGYIPEGYELRSVYYMSNAMFMTYESIDEKTISFEYCTAESSSIAIDNERHTSKEIKRCGQTYYYYEPIEDDDYSSLIWYDSDYVYSINAQLPESEFVKIAENITN